MKLNQFLLPLNLQFFSADTGAEDGGTSTGNEDTKTEDTVEDVKTTEETDKKEDNKDEKFIPKSRFDDVNTKLKDALERLDAIDKQKEDSQKEAAKKETEAKEKAGQFESLYTEVKSDLDKTSTDLNAKSQRVEVLESVVQELLDGKLKAIDKSFHDLIPEDMTVEQKLSWISKAESKGMFGTKEETPIGGSTNPATPTRPLENLSPSEMFRMAFSKSK